MLFIKWTMFIEWLIKLSLNAGKGRIGAEVITQGKVVKVFPAKPHIIT